MFIHTVLAYSNLVALIPLLQSYSQFGWNATPTLLILSTAVASVLMHLTDTKHHLNPGPNLIRYTSFCLQVDRILTLTIASWFGWYWWQTGLNYEPLYMLGFGLVGSVIGERTQDQICYLKAHLYWHFCAYSALSLVLSTS